jgi:lipopolysaccharide export system permease protein
VPATYNNIPHSADAAVALAQVRSAIDGARARVEDSERNMNAYDVEIQKKFALSVACVVFVLLGAPIALRFPRGGVGLTIGVSLGVFALYYVGLIAGESLADRGFLPPFTAMWAANILFTIVGLLLLARMGKEGSTSRGGDMSELLDTIRTWIARQARRVGLPLDRRRHAPAEQGAD